MAGKFHYGPGGPGPCGADPSNPRSTGCPYSDSPHFETMKEAEVAYAEYMSAKHGVASTVTTPSLERKENKNMTEAEMAGIAINGSSEAKKSLASSPTVTGRVLHQLAKDEDVLVVLEAAKNGRLYRATKRALANHEDSRVREAVEF